MDKRELEQSAFQEVTSSRGFVHEFFPVGRNSGPELTTLSVWYSSYTPSLSHLGWIVFFLYLLFFLDVQIQTVMTAERLPYVSSAVQCFALRVTVAKLKLKEGKKWEPVPRMPRNVVLEWVCFCACASVTFF